MQQKYDNDDPNSRFEFREEYWEQALALIEADEVRQRKKRRWLLWWCMAGLLLVAAGVGFWGTQEANRQGAKGQEANSQEAKKQGENRQIVNSQGARGQEANEQGEKGQEASSQMANRQEANEQGEKGQEASSQGANRQEANSQMASSQEAKGQGANSQGGSSQMASNKTTKNKGNRIPEETAQLLVNPLPNGRQAGKTDTVSNDLNTGKGAANSSIPQKTLTTSNVASASPDPNNPLMANQSLSNSTVGIPTETEASKAQATNEALKSFFAQIIALPLPMDSVRSNKPAVAKTPSPAAKQIKPIRDSRFELGFAAATAVYQPSPDKRWLGFSGGLFTAYNFSQSWSASVGLGIRYQPGNWQDTAGIIETESLRYSFGFESLQTQRRALGLLSLEIPIAAVWHRGQFAAEAGIAPGRLLFALERYKETTESSLKPSKTTINRLERGETSIYHQYYANAFAGLEWKFRQNASINLRGNYRFGAILKAALEDPSIKGGSNLELGLKWTFGI